jgi:hypothetical protein
MFALVIRTPPSTQTQRGDHLVGIRQVTNDFPNGQREFPNERGQRQHLVIFTYGPIIQQIDDIELVSAVQVVLTNIGEIL